MRFFDKPVDMSKVRTIVYHLPDGEPFTIQIEQIGQLFELGWGEVCDTSEFDGVLHFFPKGNA